MNKTFCDICGEEITDSRQLCRYKLKRFNTSFFPDFSWDILDVHEECWKKLCKFVRKDLA